MYNFSWQKLQEKLFSIRPNFFLARTLQVFKMAVGAFLSHKGRAAWFLEPAFAQAPPIAVSAIIHHRSFLRTIIPITSFFRARHSTQRYKRSTVIASSAAAAAVRRLAQIVELVRGTLMMPCVCYAGADERLYEHRAKAPDLAWFWTFCT